MAQPGHGNGWLLALGGEGYVVACLQCWGTARLWFPQELPCLSLWQQGRKRKTTLGCLAGGCFVTSTHRTHAEGRGVQEAWLCCQTAL